MRAESIGTYVRSFCADNGVSVEFSSTCTCPCCDVEKKHIVAPLIVDNDHGKSILTSIQHEVGHLLYTLPKSKMEDPNVWDNKNLFPIINGLEDIRIEALLGKRYIGIDKDLKEMYLLKIKGIADKMEGAFRNNFIIRSGESVAILLYEYLVQDKLKLKQYFNTETQAIFDKTRIKHKELFHDCKDSNDIVDLAKVIYTDYELQFEQGEKSDSSSGKSGAGVGTISKELSDKLSEKDVHKMGGAGSRYVPDTMPIVNELNYAQRKLVCSGAKPINDSREVSKTTTHKLLTDKYSPPNELISKIRQPMLDYFTTISRDRNILSLKKGELYSKHLFRVKTDKKPRVFSKKILHENHTISISMLCDMSGSMGGAKARSALQAMMGMYEAVKNIKQVKLELATFSAQYYNGKEHDNLEYCNHMFIKKFSEPHAMPLAGSLGDVASCFCGGNNNDYENVRFATAQLQKQQTNRKILIVLNDGQPACRAYRAIEQTRLIEKLRKNSPDIEFVSFYVCDFESREAKEHMMKAYNSYNVISVDNLSASLLRSFKDLLRGKQNG